MKKRTKKIVMFVITIGIFINILCSCSNTEKSTNPTENTIEFSEDTEEINNANLPDISQIRAICELATVEYYYHNVAKSIKEKGTGISHIGEKERAYWIEYDGIAKFGIDISKVNMNINGKQIVITIPKARLLGLTGHSFIPDSYISVDDGINRNPITAADQTRAVKESEEKIRNTFSNDNTMLMRAQNNAKQLIENYIRKLGEYSKTEYQIEWRFEENVEENEN